MPRFPLIDAEDAGPKIAELLQEYSERSGRPPGEMPRPSEPASFSTLW